MDWKSARLFKLYYKIRKLFYNMRLFIHVCSLYLCWPAVTVTIGWLPYVDSSIVLLDYLELKLKIYEIKLYAIFSQTFNMPLGFRYLWYNIRLWWFPCLELWNNILDLYVCSRYICISLLTTKSLASKDREDNRISHNYSLV